ncbi:response regulator [bacterium]|nr:response regulator [bacterium]
MNSTATEMTVFVVDDDPAVRGSLRFLMESVGLSVQTFGSAQEFLATFDADQAGCIVTDVRMLGMTGLELQERLREMSCQIPMILITAYADVPMAVRAMKHGAIHFFEKPINNHLLLEQIHQAMADNQERLEGLQKSQHIEVKYRKLTPREAEVMDEVVAGYSSKEIGQRLGVSFKTVEAHRAKIMRKMEVDNVPHLIRNFLEIRPEKRVRRESEHSGDSEAHSNE